MANDRILLYCKLCHKVRAIAKYYPGIDVNYGTKEDMQSFINSHLHVEDYSHDLTKFPIEIWTEGNWPLEKYGCIPYSTIYARKPAGEGD